MIIKLIAPGILPHDYVTTDLPGVPARGDTILIETPAGNGDYDEELLTVKSVVWSVEVMPRIMHHAVGGLVEVVCERTEDASHSTVNELVARAIPFEIERY